jgi:hypothetical protein
MRSTSILLLTTLLTVGMIALAQVGKASDSSPVAQSDAQKSFDKMKTLAGSWEGLVKTDMQQPGAMERAAAQRAKRRSRERTRLSRR